MDTAPAAPALPADVAAMLRTDGPAPMNAATVAPAVAVPPRLVPVPAVSLDADAAAVEPAPGPEAGAAAPVAPEPVQTAMAPSADAPIFAGTRARSRTVALEWPIMWKGRLYEVIVVQRPTAQQVADYYDRLLAQGDNGKGLRFPLFFDEAGAPIADEIMDALDADDADTLQADILDFLPRRLRAFQASASGSTPDAGADTEPTSNG